MHHSHRCGKRASTTNSIIIREGSAGRERRTGSTQKTARQCPRVHPPPPTPALCWLHRAILKASPNRAYWAGQYIYGLRVWVALVRLVKQALQAPELWAAHVNRAARRAVVLQTHKPAGRVGGHAVQACAGWERAWVTSGQEGALRAPPPFHLLCRQRPPFQTEGQVA